MSARHYPRYKGIETGSLAGEKSELKDMKKSGSKFPKWEINLNFGQILVSWAVISGMMIAVFILGFNSGLEDGVETTLSSRAASDIRLPIIGAQPPSSIAKDYSSIAQSDVAANASAENKKLNAGETIRDIPATAVVGYSGKSATQAIADAKNAKSLASEKVSPSAAKVNSKISGGWFVQVGSVKKSADSESLLAKVESLGLKGKVEQASLRGISFYQVLVGPYPEKETAATAMDKLKSSSSFKGRLFVKMLK